MQKPAIQNMRPMNVYAIDPAGMSNFGGAGGLSFGAQPGGMAGMASAGEPNIPVQNLAPVHVTAQSPAQPGPIQSAWMWGNDHPIASNLIKAAAGSIPLLGPVMVAANAYENAKHGQPMFGGLSSLSTGISHLFNGMGSMPGVANPGNTASGATAFQQAPLSNQPAVPGNGTGGGFSIASFGGALPYYPSSVASAGSGTAPMGGMWNQQAIHSAAPTYGPYAGMGQMPNSLWNQQAAMPINSNPGQAAAPYGIHY